MGTKCYCDEDPAEIEPACTDKRGHKWGPEKVFAPGSGAGGSATLVLADRECRRCGVVRTLHHDQCAETRNYYTYAAGDAE